MRAVHAAVALVIAAGEGCQLTSGLSELNAGSRPQQLPTQAQCEGDSACADASSERACAAAPMCEDAAAPRDAGCTGDSCADADGPVSCQTDDDCISAARPRCLDVTCVTREMAAQWLCDYELSDSAKTISFELDAIEFVTRKPPKMLEVAACRRNDAGCTVPVDTYVEEGGAGHVKLTLPQGFSGFFELHSEYMDTMLYVTQPITKDTVERAVPLLAMETLEITAELTHTSVDAEKGLVLLEAIDCSNAPQPGIHFFADSEGVAFYIVDMLPNVKAQQTVHDALNNSATGGFLNAEPGYTTFGASLGVDGPQLGEFNVQVRPGTVTFVDMHF